MAKKNKKNTELAANSNVSEFNGRLGGMIGIGIVQILVIALMAALGAVIAGFNIYKNGVIITEDLKNPVNIALVVVGVSVALIGLAWAQCIFLKWETKHMIFSGYQLKFNGTALQLFFTVLKWLFLTIITVGIYALWLPIKVRKWRAKHTTAKAVETSDYGYPQPQVTFYTYPQK